MATTIQIRRGALAGLPSGAAGEPLFTTDRFRFYIGSAGGNRLMGLLHAIDQTTAPTVNDDAGDGYSVGSTWDDTTNDKSYRCLDSTVGAAVWQQTSGTGAAGVPTTITVANEATDTTCFPLFVTAATGDLGPKTNANLALNSSTGVVTFGADPIIPDEAYGAGWNGVLEPPTKNAVYDKIETLAGSESAANAVLRTLAFG